MEMVKVKRGVLKGQITRAVTFAETVSVSTPSELLSIRIQKLSEWWSAFCELQGSYLLLLDEDSVSGAESEFAEYEAKYFVAHSKLANVVKQQQPQVQGDLNESIFERLAVQQSTLIERLNNSSVSNNSSANVALPKIIIPQFSGDYKDWPSFRDLFVSSVDSKSYLTATQKFQYLRSFVKDEAANLIRHITLSDANYADAWARLELRYDKKHFIVKSFIHSFLSLPSMSTNSVQTLRKITDSVDEIIRGLDALKQTTRDPWVIYLILRKLDSDTVQAWAEWSGSVEENHTISRFINFLQERCNALESCQPLPRSSFSRVKSSTPIQSHVTETSEFKLKCPKCAQSHNLYQCAQFEALDISSRRDFVKGHTLCFNCLRSGHTSNKCRSSHRCRVCQARHHSMVHFENSTPDATNPVSVRALSSVANTSAASGSSVSPIINNVSVNSIRRKQTLLPTLLATVNDIHGNPILCRALLDSGSQSSFVTESFVQQLGLRRSHAKIPILGLSSVGAGFTKGRVSLTLFSRINSSSLSLDAFILSRLTSNLPSFSLNPSLWSHLVDIPLADPTFNISSSIDVLLGADKLWSILLGEQIQGEHGSPIAQSTVFGWVVTGEVFDGPSHLDSALSSLHSVLDVDDLLKRFWEIEDVSSSASNSYALDPTERQFQKTIRRSSDGKYIVSLPFKVPNPCFGESLFTAVSRLKSMERRFQSNPELQTMYVDFMKEYLTLGHMSPIPPGEIQTLPGQHFYLPHHAVLKMDSLTTKLRVVFDGSSKDSKGISLNNMLLVGPPIQRDLVGVCLRFRQHRFVFAADVVKMFRQIWIDENHADFQRIVWRERSSDPIQHFRLRTVTYGTASAPFLSVRVLNQLADEYQTDYPTAAKVLKEDVYVDDIMTGADTADTLIALKNELVSLLSQAKMQLRKWSSNCWPLLASLPKEDCENLVFKPERSDSRVKVLGILWQPSDDNFSFKMSKNNFASSPTRRTLLSEVASIFDPLGFLAPSVILFKILFQELWSSELNLNWDDPLPASLAQRWKTYREELHHFETLRVPRMIFASVDDIELHGFSDASSVAYASVVYSRCRLSDGTYRVNIIAAKTKVAPLKPISIPRLELCGALLLTRLLTLIISSISKKPTRVYAWCDSEIVLYWLSSPPRRWTTFVANRVASILDVVPRSSWQYVASESNPADSPSRGLLPSLLSGHHIWWNGPPWLADDKDCWPKSKFNSKPSLSAKFEERVQSRQVLVAFNNNELVDYLLKQFSSWHAMQRIVAYCLRFAKNVRANQLRSNRLTGFLTYAEIYSARVTILRLVQRCLFKPDIECLLNKKPLPPKSKLIKFAPFVDREGLLRVGGRIRHASVSLDLMHPVILCSKHAICRLIVTEIHRLHLHTGVSATFTLVRQSFWILGSRNLIKNVVFACKPCFMQRKQTSQQLMGDLPLHRVQQSRPFTNTGCDYAGPITIKLSRTKNAKLSKAYVALFICMATKALHLELVSDLSSDAFLAALRRFIARRGRCANIYSDNGTNFQGARRWLTDMHKLALSQAHNEIVAAALAAEGIAWHFSPPSAPHFGGLWEAGVKSIKHHLRRVVGDSILVFEDLCTVLCQIESIVNSRPLCAISDCDLNPLTPSHFLIGEPMTSVPEMNYDGVPINRLKHYQLLQHMVQGFWKRWHEEYLTTLQERPKWQQNCPNLCRGDLVVIKEPNLPPTKWAMGRIEDVHPGHDQRVRVATVRTATGTFTRPIAKLARLPVS